MFRPGGYSSEEDSDDLYGCDYYTKNELVNHVKVLTEEEKDKIKVEQFYKAVSYGNYEATIGYLNEGMAVDFKFKDNWTPLLLAASSGNDLLAVELMRRGADVNQHRELHTPLMAACRCPPSTSPYEKSFRIVETLLLYKADVNAKNRKRMNALMCAASAGNIDAVNLLLQCCNKDDVDNQGWTALFWAINDNQDKVVKILLDAGLDFEKLDVRQCTPLDYAKQNGFHKIVAMLPDPEDKDDRFLAHCSHIDFYEECERPRFLRDVYMMLQGMKCESLQQEMLNRDIDLFRFLTLTVDDLERMQIEWPYIQSRILGGLFRFHKHQYNQKSVPTVAKNAVYTTADIAATLTSAMRQLITMHASVRYVNLNLPKPKKKQDTIDCITEIQNRLKITERTVKQLQKRCKEWDAANVSVDLIVPKRSSFTSRVIKWTPVFLLVTYVVYFKFRS